MQELSLVFLASVTLIWMFNNTNKKAKYFFIILIIFLQFFASTSTIAGFETSPFNGNQPFWKFYETPYEKSSLLWSEHNINKSNTLLLNPGFVSSKPLLYDKSPVIMEGNKLMIDVNSINPDTYFLLSQFDFSSGFVHQKIMKTSNVGSSSKVKLSPFSKKQSDNVYNVFNVYDNGFLDIYKK